MERRRSLLKSSSSGYESQYFTIESQANNNVIKIKTNDEEEWFYNPVSINKNNSGWVPWKKDITETGETLCTLNQGEKVCIKCKKNENEGWSVYGSSYGFLKCISLFATKNFIVYGNIMSLVCYDDFDQHSLDYFSNGVFGGLFKDATTLTDAQNLVFPTDKPTQYCYCQMFSGCTNLLYAPKELPATQVNYGCYKQMFYGCSSLISVPNSLPALNGTYAQCYSQMFGECSSLEESPKIYLQLPQYGVGEFYCMFYKCTSLRVVRAYFLQKPNQPSRPETSKTFYRWLYNVSPTGTFYRNPNATWSTTDSDIAIPSGWTVVNDTSM